MLIITALNRKLRQENRELHVSQGCTVIPHLKTKQRLENNQGGSPKSTLASMYPHTLTDTHVGAHMLLGADLSGCHYKMAFGPSLT